MIARLKHAGWALILAALVWFFWCGFFYNIQLAFAAGPIRAHGGRTPCPNLTACRAAVKWQKHRYAHEHLIVVHHVRRDASYALRLAAAMSGLPLSNLRCIGWNESRMGAQTTAQPGSGAKGLMQFLDSTWSHTPFAAYGFSVWDNVANALAAVQIIVHDGSARQWDTGSGCGL